jgi:hypothetical protein
LASRSKARRDTSFFFFAPSIILACFPSALPEIRLVISKTVEESNREREREKERESQAGVLLTITTVLSDLSVSLSVSLSGWNCSGQVYSFDSSSIDNSEQRERELALNQAIILHNPSVWDGRRGGMMMASGLVLHVRMWFKYLRTWELACHALPCFAS